MTTIYVMFISEFVLRSYLTEDTCGSIEILNADLDP